MKSILPAVLLSLVALLSVQGKESISKAVETRMRADSNVVSFYVEGLHCKNCASDIYSEMAELAFVDASRFESGLDFDKEGGFFIVAVKASSDIEPKALKRAIDAAGFGEKSLWLYELADGKLKAQQLVK